MPHSLSRLGVSFLPLCVCLAALLPAQGPSFLERAKLTSTDPAASALSAVAISGDTVVVGDWLYGVGGAALVFEKPATGWLTATQPVVLTPSDGAAGEHFGATVAIDGDTVVVGVPRSGSAQNGAAYVFEKPAGGWADMTETVKLTPCCATAGYTFGASVAIDGDTIVVGASQGNQVLGRPGGAHLFEKPPSASWTQATESARFAASDPNGRDLFGIAVAIHGDTVAVGASSARVNNTFGAGAVYVFEKPAGGWVTNFETAKLTASDVQFNGSLGEVVAVGPDYVAAGSSGVDGRRGAVYVYEERASGWVSATETAELTASDAVANDYLGGAVAVDDDTIVAGARGDDSAGSFWAGAVYVFEEPASGWSSATEVAKFGLGPRSLQAGTTGAMFASGVAIDGGVIAASSLNVLPEGAAYVFEEPPSVPGSGCGLDDTGLSGSTRIGKPFDMRVSPCSGAGVPEFILGVPLAQPFAFPPALSCTGAAQCLLSCNPIIRLPGPSLSFSWANDPSFVGISLCLQGLCIEPAVPCLEISNMVTITITS